MTHGRIETTPEQQLAELRQAYARYNTLADRLHDDDAVDAQVRAVRERNARRIALAYEKSIASTAMRMESMHRANAQSRGFTRLAKGLSLMLAAALIVCGALVAYLRPDIREKFASYIPARETPVAARIAQTEPPIGAPVTASVPAPAPAAAMPAPPAEPMPLVTPAPRPAQPTDQAATRTAAIAPPSNPVAKKVAVPQKDETREAPRAIQSAPAPSVTAPIKQTEAKRAEPPAPSPVKPAEPLVAAPAPPAPAQATVEPLSPPRDVAALPTPPQISAAEIPQAAVNVIETPAAPEPAAQTQTSKLVPVMRTHVRPPYPLDAKRAGEQGTTQMQVSISAQGAITDCKVTGTSGSERLDSTACGFVKRYWRWQPRETSGTSKIAVVWNLIAGR